MLENAGFSAFSLYPGTNKAHFADATVSYFCRTNRAGIVTSRKENVGDNVSPCMPSKAINTHLKIPPCADICTGWGF